MRTKKPKYDKDFKKIVKVLAIDFGWSNLQVLPVSMLDLLNDTVKATKKYKQL